ncbi:hypothetical protein KIN20_008373 [Parelaphostrongylus tenuis]|uniref:Uncharacterized protein n=1 Tax=Parelaphostrongylus tenuis TaxID=148309 RepID=A0AAD5MWQ5_PARTN|nr:hypothetical protein KIN20_008373 [Parelaphostrongylus tenuis]
MAFGQFDSQKLRSIKSRLQKQGAVPPCPPAPVESAQSHLVRVQFPYPQLGNA